MKRNSRWVVVCLAVALGLISGTQAWSAGRPAPSSQWRVAPTVLRAAVGRPITLTVTYLGRRPLRYYQPYASDSCGRVSPIQLWVQRGGQYQLLRRQRGICHEAIIAPGWRTIAPGQLLRLTLSSSGDLGQRQRGPIAPGRYRVVVRSRVLGQKGVLARTWLLIR